MSDILIGNYSPEAVNVIISVGDFTHQVTGFVEGTFISATRMVPASEPYIGSDLSGGRVKRRNRSMNVTVSLHQYAQSNYVLQALQRADEGDDGNTYVAAMTIKDQSGQTMFFSSQTIIATTPDVTLSSTTEQRDWTFFMFNTDNYIGGNTPLDAAAVQAVEAVGGVVEDRWKA
jgi:uncharacterized cupredoxin-like copper-binding protein